MPPHCTYPRVINTPVLYRPRRYIHSRTLLPSCQPARTYPTRSAQVRHRAWSPPPPLPHPANSILSGNFVSSASSACLIEHGVQDTGPHCTSEAGARCILMTSYGQAAVFTAHVYKSSILFSMAAWVCWAHGSWGLSESPKRSRGPALPVLFFCSGGAQGEMCQRSKRADE